MRGLESFYIFAVLLTIRLNTGVVFGAELQPSTHTGKWTSAVCTVCKAAMDIIIGYRREGMEEAAVENLLKKLCVFLNIETENVCRGVIELNAPIILYIMDHKPNISSESVCGVVLQTSSCPLKEEQFEWTIDVDSGATTFISSEPTDETITIVHLSDFHYDPAYEVFGNAYCDEPICCRKGQNVTNTSSKVAGYWGSYNKCDTPWHSLLNVFDQVKNSEKDITYIYFTGDIIDNGVWETTKDGIIKSINEGFNELYKKFRGIPIYPILGNHESNPTNVFAPSVVVDEKVNTAWLYELMADIWINSGWLPESTRSTILKGGFYTLSPKAGFRIIALNNNVCYTYNWWLLYEPQDPNGQLAWLAGILYQAERDGEYVHILAHIPPGDSTCQYTWGREYRRIINRFAHIITGQFNGHTHTDEFRLIYDLNDPTKPINVAWNGGSVSTYTMMNLNYRVYIADANTYEIEDAATWIYNLTLANETPDKNPIWFKSYSFKEEYGLWNMSLDSLNDLVIRMARNSSILSTYYNHSVKQADPLLESGCDDSCLANLLCKIVTADPQDSTQCNYFTNL